MKSLEENRLAEVRRRVLASDVDFLEDVLAWLSSHAPRRLGEFLRDLCYPHHPPNGISHEVLCEAIWKFRFRANGVIERRMILGDANKWVRLYFEEFPIGLP